MDNESHKPVTDADGNELGKIFIGGLAQETDNAALRDYFKHYGDIEEAVVMMDNRTKRSRGFGYVKFTSHQAVTFALSQGKHEISGKEVDAKFCNVNMKGRNRRSLKVFLGGIAPETNEDDIRRAMSQHGTVTDVNLMMDPTKLRHRGFAYVGFSSDITVKHLIGLRFVNIGSKQVEVKAMEPPRFGPRPNQAMSSASSGRSREHVQDIGASGDWSSPSQGSWQPQSQSWTPPWQPSHPPPWAAAWSTNSNSCNNNNGSRNRSNGNISSSSGGVSSWESRPPPSWAPPWASGPPAPSRWEVPSVGGSSAPLPPPPPPLQTPGQWSDGHGWEPPTRPQAPPPPAFGYHQNAPPPIGHGFHPYKRS